MNNTSCPEPAAMRYQQACTFLKETLSGLQEDFFLHSEIFGPTDVLNSELQDETGQRAAMVWTRTVLLENFHRQNHRLCFSCQFDDSQLTSETDAELS